MSKVIRAFVAPRDVASVVLDLSKVEGVSVSLSVERAEAPDPEKEHPAYMTGFAELAPVIISISGAATSLIALATALLNYKKAAREAEKKAGEPAKPPIIVINNTTIQVAEFATPELLAAHLTERLNQLPAVER